MRGVATGANGYFAFNVSKARRHNIDERYLVPCVCRSIDVRGSFFTEADFGDLKKRDKNVFLLDAVNSDDENVIKYLTKGEEDEVDKRFLTANRNPWYSLEKRPPAPIWASVFNRAGLRFIRNETDALNLTAFHCVYPKTGLLGDVSVDLLFAYLLTDTAKRIFEDNGREYGNGLRKFEPSDLNKGNMLDLRRLPAGAIKEIGDLYQKNRSCGDRQFVKKIDAVLAENFI
jgi:adenine-specific DNA-methyltransferase